MSKLERRSFPATITVSSERTGFNFDLEIGDVVYPERDGDTFSFIMQADRRIAAGGGRAGFLLETCFRARVKGGDLICDPVVFEEGLFGERRAVNSEARNGKIDRLLDEIGETGGPKIGGGECPSQVTELLRLSAQEAVDEAGEAVGKDMIRQLEIAMTRAVLREVVPWAGQMGLKTVKLVVNRASSGDWYSALELMGFEKEHLSTVRRNLASPLDKVFLVREIDST